MLNNDGTLRWQMDPQGSSGGRGQNGEEGPLSLVADLDLDGSPEVVAGNTAYRYDGTLYWSASVTDGFPAVGNFDADPFPEVVLVSERNVYMLEHDGQVKWGPSAIPKIGIGGAPTIADMDGDGQLEIGVAGAYRYTVYEGDGSVRWSKDVQDGSSMVTGSSVFDFNGDGSAEVVYGDEVALRIYRGSDGQVLYELPKSSQTAVELPVIVDVDADGNAEIVAVANRTARPDGVQTGIYVIGDASDNWVTTRRIWNQHTYHITNVNDDSTIPAHEANSWQVHNTYRLQAQPGLNPLVSPDLTASYVQVSGTNGAATITARIGNGGELFVPPLVSIAFYDGDPQDGGNLLGTTFTRTRLEPGQYEDVSIPVPTANVRDVWVAADDDGTGQGQVREPNETNNLYHAPLSKWLPTISIASPADEAEFPAGTTVLVSGKATIASHQMTPTTLTNRIVAVFVNDSPVHVLDIAGNFFTQITVLAGDNNLEFTALDASGQAAVTHLTLHGTQGPGDPLDQVFDVSPSFQPAYARTSFHDKTQMLYAQLAVRNVGLYEADKPFFVGVVNISDPTVTVQEALGVTRDGIPYYDLNAVIAGDSLSPNDSTGFVDATFHNPNRVQFTYDLVFLAKLNSAPAFTSMPGVETHAGWSYAYDAKALDPDGDTVAYSLLMAPGNMSIDKATGKLTWLPAIGDLGGHPVVIRADDGRGGVAEQQFFLP